MEDHMFPKTLMSVLGSEQTIDTLKSDISLAAANGCHLAVQIIGIAPPPPTSVYGIVPAEAWTEERELASKATKAKAEEAGAAIASAGISADITPTYCDFGQVAGHAAMRARHADLAIVHGGPSMDDRLRREVLKGLLFESAKPCLIVPGARELSLHPKKVAIAWNASREAARALHMALDLLAGTEAVHVSMVDPSASEDGLGVEPGSDIAAYLARHGLNVTVDILAGGGRDAAEVLLRHVKDVAADMLVAGAYGHSRLREYLFGGTTRSLLHDADIPVFIAH
jgi:nucleotide-binding universal stress UspA family protein